MDVTSAAKFVTRHAQLCGEVLPHAGIGYSNIFMAERPHFRDDGILRSCIVLVLNRHGRQDTVSLEERFLKLYGVLNESLIDDEHLECRNRDTLCVGKGYEISIVVEAYKKRPSLTVFMDSLGKVRVEALRRMCTRESVKRARALTEDRRLMWNWNIAKSPFARYLDEPELVERFPNAADRLAFIAKRETKKSPLTYAELMAQFKM